MTKDEFIKKGGWMAINRYGDGIEVNAQATIWTKDSHGHRIVEDSIHIDAKGQTIDEAFGNLSMSDKFISYLDAPIQ